MNEKDLADTLDRILSERLRENRSTYLISLRLATVWVIRGTRSLLGMKPRTPLAAPAPWEWELIARIRTLPEHMQDALRRYYVFREAEDRICDSMDASPGEFRRFLREATEYILMRSECMPEFDPQRHFRGRKRA